MHVHRQVIVMTCRTHALSTPGGTKSNRRTPQTRMTVYHVLSDGMHTRSVQSLSAVDLTTRTTSRPGISRVQGVLSVCLQSIPTTPHTHPTHAHTCTLAHTHTCAHANKLRSPSPLLSFASPCTSGEQNLCLAPSPDLILLRVFHVLQAPFHW